MSVIPNCSYNRPLEPLLLRAGRNADRPKKSQLVCQVLRTLPPVDPVPFKASLTTHMLNDANIGFYGL